MAGGSLLAALKQYVGDALPGGSLSPELAPARKYGEGVAQRAGQLVRDPTEFARQALLDVVPNRAEAQAAQARVMGGSLDPRAYSGYLGKMQDLGGLLGSIRVYHGSPHKFDKFDLSKIGTGEGAQAYGHGLYTAESRNVAEQYKNVLSDTLEAPANTPLVTKRAGQMALTFGDNTAEGAVKWLQKHRNGANHTSPAMTPELVDDVIRRFQSGEFRPGGNLYEANLRWPDAAREAADPLGPQHFLDWDKPLSEQPEAVRNVLSGFGVKSGETADEIAKRMISYGMSASDAMEYGAKNAYQNTGALAYAELGRDASASEKLRKAGIPGIRYLDAGSRGAGQGSSNYVVFDDNLIDILTRNGVPIGK